MLPVTCATHWRTGGTASLWNTSASAWKWERNRQQFRADVQLKTGLHKMTPRSANCATCPPFTIMLKSWRFSIFEAYPLGNTSFFLLCRDFRGVVGRRYETDDFNSIMFLFSGFRWRSGGHAGYPNRWLHMVGLKSNPWTPLLLAFTMALQGGSGPPTAHQVPCTAGELSRRFRVFLVASCCSDPRSP